MSNYIKLVSLGLIIFFSMMAINYARDEAYLVHAIIIMLVASGLFFWTLSNTDEPTGTTDFSGEYMDGVIRYGVIATA
ncbi:MAG: cytochrome-c oxidase, cbb3-type subunit I, partial [Pseudomonadota bacterium]